MNQKTKSKNHRIHELLPQLFSRSAEIILDFSKIPLDLPNYQNIESYFAACIVQGYNPRLPENRQKFNNTFLQKTGKRYLIGNYAEDRMQMLQGSEIADEGRTLHLGIDIFTQHLEPVYAPCNAEVINVGRDKGYNSFGHYVILKPDPEVTPHYILLGHLSKNLPGLGPVTRGQPLAVLGDYRDRENGGWARHLHVQLLASAHISDKLPPGYSSLDDLAKNLLLYPDPSFLLKEGR